MIQEQKNGGLKGVDDNGNRDNKLVRIHTGERICRTSTGLDSRVTGGG